MGIVNSILIKVEAFDSVLVQSVLFVFTCSNIITVIVGSPVNLINHIYVNYTILYCAHSYLGGFHMIININIYISIIVTSSQVTIHCTITYDYLS